MFILIVSGGQLEVFTLNIHNFLAKIYNEMKIFVEEMLAGRRTTLVAGKTIQYKQFPIHCSSFLANIIKKVTTSDWLTD